MLKVMMRLRVAGDGTPFHRRRGHLGEKTRLGNMGALLDSQMAKGNEKGLRLDGGGCPARRNRLFPTW